MCRREAEGEGEAMKRGMDRIAGKKVCRGRKNRERKVDKESNGQEEGE